MEIHGYWTWDENKNAVNIGKHGLSFETATLVFTDALALTTTDPYEHEERYRTVGVVGHLTIVVIHTEPVDSSDAFIPGRIISARKATRTERLDYENG